MTYSKNKPVLIIIAVCVLIGGTVLLWGTSAKDAQEEIACTLEAKICPDGSVVGRTGPQCEFAACPSVEESDQWESATDPETNAFFRYPKVLPTFYSEALDWPPDIQVLDDPFTCTEAGDATARAGKTEIRIINGREYCVTEVTEGAAGSVFTQYAYMFPLNSKAAVLTFSTRSVQCGNFDEQQKRGCEEEKSTFNLDALIDQVAESVEIGQ